MQVNTDTEKIEPLCPVDSDLVKIGTLRQFVRSQKREGVALRPGATWKLKQESGSGLSPSWSQFPMMDLNPGSVWLENYSREHWGDLEALRSWTGASGTDGSSGREPRKPRTS